ncbi:MAG: hypothetical protein NT162_03245 [Candidatus Woesebacteria bacterium]|nr:hypothetical protein [Candidatus Woesebacteria bacterium]
MLDRLIRSIQKVLHIVDVLGTVDILGAKVERLETNTKNLLNSCSAGSITKDQKAIFRSHEFKVYSENSEDGLINYIFSKIGCKDHTFVEIGCGNGQECNSANLSINLGWSGILIDVDKGNIKSAKNFYQDLLGKQANKVKPLRKFINKENVNQVIKNNIKGEVDLLSIDIDGVDYWVWKAVDVIRPRVVVIEYNASLGDKDSLTVKYKPHFNRFDYQSTPIGWYLGASLKALTKLGRQKGYTLVGCVSAGANAFFVREDLVSKKLPKMTVEQAYYPHLVRSRKMSSTEQKNATKTLDFIEV